MLLSSDPEIMGGSICITGTRIPISVLLDNLVAGVPMHEILDDYPDLKREQVQKVIDWSDRKAREALGLKPRA